MSMILLARRATQVFSHASVGLIVATAVGVGISQNAGAEPMIGQGSVFTANEEGASLSRLDLQSGNVQSISLPIMPHNVDVSASAGLVFVVGLGIAGGATMSDQTGNSQMNMAMAGGENEPSGRLVILKLDAVEDGPISVIGVGDHPAHVVPDLGGKRVFVTDSESSTVSVIDLQTGKSLKTIPTGRYPHGLRLSPDGRELYVANVEGGSVSVIDVAKLAESARIPVGKAPVQVGFTPDGSRVYVSLRDEDSVAVIDRATGQVVTKIAVNRGPIQVFVTPDGKFVYVANQGSDADPDNRVSIIDVATNKVVKTLTVGAGAHGVTISPDGRFAYISNIKDNSVSVIDVQTQAVVRTIPVGKGPNGITVFSGNS